MVVLLATLSQSLRQAVRQSVVCGLHTRGTEDRALPEIWSLSGLSLMDTLTSEYAFVIRERLDQLCRRAQPRAPLSALCQQALTLTRNRATSELCRMVGGSRLIIMNDLQKVDMLPCPVSLAIIASCSMSIESMMTHAGKEHYSALFSDV